jgi:putative PIN family toxin of toxin-antitoxin system
MRLVVDTNVLVSALLLERSPPARLLAAWRRGRFVLLTAAPQLEELRRVTRYPRIKARFRPALAGELVNQLRDLAETIAPLPRVDISPNPFDNYLLAIAQAGHADVLVSGDRQHLLELTKVGTCRIVTVGNMLDELE